MQNDVLVGGSTWTCRVEPERQGRVESDEEALTGTTASRSRGRAVRFSNRTGTASSRPCRATDRTNDSSEYGGSWARTSRCSDGWFGSLIVTTVGGRRSTSAGSPDELSQGNSERVSQVGGTDGVAPVARDTEQEVAQEGSVRRTRELPSRRAARHRDRACQATR